MDEHLVPLTGDWALWRDFAVRSAGFPVGGLDVFGSSDESARLAEVAGDPLFGEAVAWQNRSAYRTAVAKIAGAGAESGSKRRQRDGVVAGYWQRYCSKNDTVGFFGPLAWGEIRNGGPAVEVRSRGLISSRRVHFEAWCLEAVARAVGTKAVVPLNRTPEIELRRQLEELGDASALTALDALEAAREDVSVARGAEAILAALDRFDACMEEVTGEPPAPSDDGAEGGRTPLYLDCMRDLNVQLGTSIVDELAATLPVLLEASRWWCGRSFAHGRAVIDAALADGLADGPLAPRFQRAFGELWQLPRTLAAELPELQERCESVIAEGDVAILARRAASTFSDHGPAWPLSVFQSADVQIAARNVDAINRGDFLAVVGDYHPGNPLVQALFSTRYPDPARFRTMFHADVGQPILVPPLPRNPGVRLSSRNAPDPSDPMDVHLLGPGITPVHVGYRSLPIDELTIEGDHVVDLAGEFRAPLTDLFFLPMFISAMNTFQPFPETGPRIKAGRTVLRRATWRVPVADRPAEAADVSRWAADLGLPRRVFALPTGEPKPVYVDFASPSLTRNLHRMLGRAINADAEASVRFSEMLPGPEDCWLEHEGARFTSELRIVAVDRTRRGGGTLPEA